MAPPPVGVPSAASTNVSAGGMTPIDPAPPKSREHEIDNLLKFDLGGFNGIDMDPAHDAAYWPPYYNTGNYTYSVKPNEYTGWNGDSYTHNYQSTGDFSGANRVPDHKVPAFTLGIDKPSQIKTEYGEHPHTAKPEPCTSCW